MTVDEFHQIASQRNEYIVRLVAFGFRLIS